MKYKADICYEDDELGVVEETIELPGKYEVCDRCNGTGVHDHPAFSNGITMQEFAEDPDFAESYFKGHYDVQCSVCHGLRVILVPDDFYADHPKFKDTFETFAKAQAYMWEIEAEKAHEQRLRERGIQF